MRGFTDNKRGTQMLREDIIFSVAETNQRQ